MCQVLFTIPLKTWFGFFWDLPINGYGFMLFLAFVGCTLLAWYLARKQGIAFETINDLALWLFISGIVGARIVYVIQYWDVQFAHDLGAMLRIWDGGLVFYGSAIGGAFGYIGFYYWVVKRKAEKTSFWKLADIIAPCIAVGLFLGRIGCLLNGCCYGGVACPDCPSVSFPLPATPRYDLVRNGYQLVAGFITDAAPGAAPRVIKVEPNSPAAKAKLQEGDIIVAVDGQVIETNQELSKVFRDWQSERRGQNALHLVVERDGEEKSLAGFVPLTIGLHPTQIYESISTGLLTFLLMSYFPFRRHDGEAFILLMLCYSIHRFLNEALRIDTDPVLFDMTLSQNISLVLFLTAIGLGIWMRRQPPDYGPQARQPEVDALPPEKKPVAIPETALQD